MAVVAVMTALLGCGQSLTSETPPAPTEEPETLPALTEESETPPAPTEEPETPPAPTEKPETPTKVPEEDVKSLSPEDVIPLALPGFKLIEKKTHVSPLFGGPAIQGRVEYYAYTLFQPEANSKFEGKVKSLKVLVYLFKDIESCNEYLATRTGDLPEIQVNSGRAVLVDNEFTGGDGQYYEVFAYQQYGTLLIISRTNSTPSRHLFGPYPCTWDKQAVKEAAIQGLENVRL